MGKLYLLIISILITSCSVVGIRNYEEPNYTILVEEENFEIREYSEILVAQTTTAGTYKESSSVNFKRLASYIFGENVIKEKISMATPVLQENNSEKMAMTVPVYQQQKDTNWTMTFVLPSKYSLETIPSPLDVNVLIKVLPNIKVATLRYRGKMNETNVNKYTQILTNWLNTKGYRTTSNPYSAAYDPPWTLPILRRNEVHITIE